MVSRRGKYVLASPRIDLTNERHVELLADAKRLSTKPKIVCIHGQSSGGRPVLEQIADAWLTYHADSHVILLITHEGLMGADLSGFAGWEVYIDESPSAVWSDRFTAPALAVYLKQDFELEWDERLELSRVRAKKDVRLGELIRDPTLRKLAPLRKRACSPQGLYVDVKDWDDVIGSDRELNWLWVWTPIHLSAFAKVTIVGAGYLQSLGYKAACRAGEFTFVEERIERPVAALPKVRICYFTTHRGSTTYWMDEGSGCLLAVRDHLIRVGHDGYWSANKDAFKFLQGLPGVRVSPRQEGSNSLSSHTSCALIYSAKATPSDKALKEYLGLTDEDVRLAREDEDIRQFMLRGALRDPTFVGVFTAYLYDREQAARFADWVTKEGIAEVELVPVHEAGIMDVERPLRGPKKKTPDAKSKAEMERKRRASNRAAKARQRQRRKEQKERDGTARPPGRPKKSMPLSPHAKAYRRSVRNGLTPKAYRARYCWKPDLRSTLNRP
ncbi:hypothetical protein [Alsobacter sp. R-9]